MKVPQEVKHEFRKEIRGELRTLERAVREFASTIRSAVRGIAEAAVDAQSETLEEGAFAAAITEWAETIPLHWAGRSQRPVLQHVREIGPLLSSPLKPDKLYEARDSGGVDLLPPRVTLQLATLICSAVFEALGVDPNDLAGATVDQKPAPAPPPEPHTDELAEEARRCIEIANREIRALQAGGGKRARDVAKRAQALLDTAEAQFGAEEFAAALDTCESARATIAAADEDTGGKTTSA